ncbi:phosphoglycolate phosphatase [Xanthomonas arboricola pv. pruni str. MAFF 311562]|uniref:phosphoglycolate phosphatase n=1 Tax=Xanthomonas arboricola pv. pruni str. MAFF 311562 TaxID=1414836 RepID=W4S331_9XANT|nr:phosphoglycolate phosphatase [Xanthomonas arboricola pv. pruni str. MAFF 311562]
MFPYPLVIFDLDGTLVDSAPNIAEALNATLQELGLQQFSEATIRSWIGEGVHVLLATALREAGGTHDADTEMPLMMRHYQASLLHNPQLYPGVAEALAGLREAGATLALCTNKQRASSRRCSSTWASLRISAACSVAIRCRSANPMRRRCCTWPNSSGAHRSNA